MLPTVRNTAELRSLTMRAARAHDAALVPASRDEIAKELAMLSTATIPWNQDDRETRMQMELLMGGIADVPPDVLKSACRAYMLKPGRRFFPKSPGELREFIDKPLDRRRRHAARLHAIHAELERRAAEEDRRRKQDEEWTPAKVAEANAAFAATGVRLRYRYIGNGKVEVEASSSSAVD